MVFFAYIPRSVFVLMEQALIISVVSNAESVGKGINIKETYENVTHFNALFCDFCVFRAIITV